MQRLDSASLRIPVADSKKMDANCHSRLVLPQDLVDGCFASQRNRGVSLHPERQFTSWASPASDAQDAQDATNNFC